MIDEKEIDEVTDSIIIVLSLLFALLIIFGNK